MQERTYDYVIVGAGSAGCVLANRLSADPGVRVALLEAGGKDSYFWIRIPIGYLYTMNNTAHRLVPRRPSPNRGSTGAPSPIPGGSGSAAARPSTG